jgi:hypothetical protein
MQASSAIMPAALYSTGRVGQQLLAHLLLEVARIADAGDDDGRGRRQQQRRDLGHQAVADGQQRVLAEGSPS